MAQPLDCAVAWSDRLSLSCHRLALSGDLIEHAIVDFVQRFNITLPLYMLLLAQNLVVFRRVAVPNIEAVWIGPVDAAPALPSVGTFSIKAQINFISQDAEHQFTQHPEFLDTTQNANHLLFWGVRIGIADTYGQWWPRWMKYPSAKGWCIANLAKDYHVPFDSIADAVSDYLRNSGRTIQSVQLRIGLRHLELKLAAWPFKYQLVESRLLVAISNNNCRQCKFFNADRSSMTIMPCAVNPTVPNTGCKDWEIWNESVEPAAQQ